MKKLIVVVGLLFSTAILFAKTVLLTGGAGFIGSHVAQALLRRGDAVVIIDNLNDYYDIKLKRHNLAQVQAADSAGQLTIYEIDIRAMDELDVIVAHHKPDVICHLAARAGVRASLLMPQEYITSNIVGTSNIFQVAHAHTISHVVYASSSSVYGNSLQAPYTEDLSIVTPISPYAMTKAACEMLAYTYHYLYGLSSTGLRFFTVYGPSGRVDMAPFIFLDAIYHEKPIHIYGDGSATRDFTFVDDIVDGVVRAIDTPCGYQVLNLGRGEPVVLLDFIRVIERVVGKKAELIFDSAQKTDVALTHADVGRALNLLGYAPKTSVFEGMQKTYAWYVNEYLPLTGEK